MYKLLFEKLVNLDSATFNSKDAKTVGNILRLQFEQLGFKTNWMKMKIFMFQSGLILSGSNITTKNKTTLCKENITDWIAVAKGYSCFLIVEQMLKLKIK
jgi:hypothetical protein